MLSNLLNKLVNINWHAVLSPAATNLLFLVLVILVLSFLIDFLMSNSILGRKYRIFVGPGVIIHEFSHAIFCILTGAKIRKMALFDEDGGYVEHTPSKIPIFGQAIISFAPFGVGLLTIYFLAKMMGLPEVDFSFSAFNQEVLFDLAKKMVHFLGTKMPMNVALFYLIISICVTMLPSWQDLANAIISVILILLIYIGAVKYFSWHLSIPAELMNALSLILGSVILVLILCLLISIIMYAISLAFAKR